MASRSTTTVAQILSCPDQHVDPNQDPKAAKQQSEQKGKRKIWNLDTYMEIYNKRTAATSSGAPAVLTRPAQSTDPFGPLDLSKHPLLPFDPEVAADMQERRNISKRLQNLDPRSQDSPQYLWSWTVYFIRHIGRPPLAVEVREAFKSAHPTLKAGGRTIGHGQGQEWL